MDKKSNARRFLLHFLENDMKPAVQKNHAKIGIRQFGQFSRVPFLH